jgi:hypothetical protein
MSRRFEFDQSDYIAREYMNERDKIMYLALSKIYEENGLDIAADAISDLSNLKKKYEKKLDKMYETFKEEIVGWDGSGLVDY